MTNNLSNTNPNGHDHDHDNENDGSTAIDLLRDSLSPQSHQNPSALPPNSPSSNHQSQRDAATSLFADSEILAPMVRASTTPLRILALSHGASLVYSEEMVDRSIVPAERVLNESLGTIDYIHPKHKFSAKVQKRMEKEADNPDGKILLRIDPRKERGKFVYQMGTGEGHLALEAAEKVYGDADGIDVNMGCPKKFSVSGGMGSHIPARWETLVEVVRQLKQTESVPVIVNGDLYTRADINELKRRSGCDGIMLARPALYNISLFRRGDAPERTLDNSQSEERERKHDSALEDDVPLSEFQSRYHEGYYGYNSPLLLPRSAMIQEYIAHCVRYKTHPKNAKYVVCEMMNIRRAPTERAPFLNMNYPGDYCGYLQVPDIG
ncbi:LOW QUALITY PROTEIN: hypothetical protein ACHAXS_003627 [Conticribra weissflogii]